MGKFKIHPFGQDKAILNENGLILRKRPYLETRPFYQKMSVHKKRLIYCFWSFWEFPWLLIPFAVCFLCIAMWIQSSYKCLYIGISLEAVWIALNSIVPTLQIYNAIALFTKISKNRCNFYLNSQLWIFKIPNKNEVPAIKLIIP